MSFDQLIAHLDNEDELYPAEDTSVPEDDDASA